MGAHFAEIGAKLGRRFDEGERGEVGATLFAQDFDDEGFRLNALPLVAIKGEGDIEESVAGKVPLRAEAHAALANLAGSVLTRRSIHPVVEVD